MALYRGSCKLAGIGNGFAPQNVGEEGQVLTKTAGGYAYCNPQGGDTGPKLDIMVVGGGGGGGDAYYYDGGRVWMGVGGGGGGGAVKKCYSYPIQGISFNVCIGCGGGVGCNGGDTIFCGSNTNIVAMGGGFGGSKEGQFSPGKDGGLGGNGGGGGGQTNCYTMPYRGGIGIQGNSGGNSSSDGGGGGGGAGGQGLGPSHVSCGLIGGMGGQGVTGIDFNPGLDINCLFGTGGSGGGCSAGQCSFPGGGRGGAHYVNATAADFYGGGGGGAGCCGSRGSAGYQGITIIKYPTDGSYGVNSSTGGDNCYTCNGYCYVEFTSDGTFCIVS